MNVKPLRKRLAKFLGANRYHKLIAELHAAKRLRFWQEKAWDEFTRLHPEYSFDFDEIQAALRICELHGCDLEFGSVGIFHGSVDHTNRYLHYRTRLFPHAASEPASTEDALLEGKTAKAWYCRECRAAEAMWKEQLSPVVTIEDIRLRREQLPHLGLPVEELQRAMEIIAVSPDIFDKRVMGFRSYSDGHLLVRTGAQLGGLCGGGSEVLLRKNGLEWVLVEVSIWAS